MSFKFIVKNFQSIEYQEFDIKDFTLLVGSSNLGKSAVVRALRALLYCEFEKSYVRVGSDISSLTLLFNEVNSLGVSKIEYTRSYTKNINSYKVFYLNGDVKDYEKVGTSTPEELKVLGFNLISVDKISNSLNPNFQSQLEGLFLFNISNTDMSSFLNKIFNVDKFEIALRECNKDILNFTKDFNTTKKELNDLKFSLEDLRKDVDVKKLEFEKARQIKLSYDKYMSLLSVIDRVKKVRQEILDINEKKKKIDYLSNLYSSSLRDILTIKNLVSFSNKKISIIQGNKKLDILNSFHNKIISSGSKLNTYFNLRKFKYLKSNLENKSSSLSSLDMLKSKLDIAYKGLKRLELLIKVKAYKESLSLLNVNHKKVELKKTFLISLNHHLKIILNLKLIQKKRLILNSLKDNYKKLNGISFKFIDDLLEKSGLVCKECGQKKFK